jgi:acyl carrier protein
MEFEKIRAVIAEQLNTDASGLTLETAFSDLGADSLDLFQIISELEDVFDIELDMEAVEKVKTINDAVTIIQSKL